MADNNVEGKVVYRDGPNTRVLRGVVSEEGDFIVVRRRDGEYKIQKRLVEQIIRKGGP